MADNSAASSGLRLATQANSPATVIICHILMQKKTNQCTQAGDTTFFCPLQTSVERKDKHMKKKKKQPKNQLYRRTTLLTIKCGIKQWLAFPGYVRCTRLISMICFPHCKNGTTDQFEVMYLNNKSHHFTPLLHLYLSLHRLVDWKTMEPLVLVKPFHLVVGGTQRKCQTN